MDKFINSFLIFFLFAILSSILYLHFATQTFAFQKYFSENIEPKIRLLNKSLSGFSDVFNKECIDITIFRMCVLKERATNSTDLLANAVNAIHNLIVNIVNVPLRIFTFVALFFMSVINFISLIIAIILVIPKIFSILDVFAFAWTGIIVLIVLLIVIVYLVWKLIKFIRGYEGE